MALMLYLVSLGLFDEKDISARGIDALKKCSRIFMELYTSPIKPDIPLLEALVWKKIEILERRGVEEEGIIIQAAKAGDTAFIVPGDALCATTHQQIAFDARKQGIPVEVIHGSSVFTAVAETGLSLYKFGATVSLPRPEKNYFPESPYLNIFENKKRGLHTLILLDVGMPVEKGVEILTELEKKQNKKLFSEGTMIIAVAHLGKNSLIKYGALSDLKKADFGALPHALVLPGELTFSEIEFVSQFKV